MKGKVDKAKNKITLSQDGKEKQNNIKLYLKAIAEMQAFLIKESGFEPKFKL